MPSIDARAGLNRSQFCAERAESSQQGRSDRQIVREMTIRQWRKGGLIRDELRESPDIASVSSLLTAFPGLAGIPKPTAIPLASQTWTLRNSRQGLQELRFQVFIDPVPFCLPISAFQ